MRCRPPAPGRRVRRPARPAADSVPCLGRRARQRAVTDAANTDPTEAEPAQSPPATTRGRDPRPHGLAAPRPSFGMAAGAPRAGRAPEGPSERPGSYPEGQVGGAGRRSRGGRLDASSPIRRGPRASRVNVHEGTRAATPRASTAWRCRAPQPPQTTTSSLSSDRSSVTGPSGSAPAPVADAGTSGETRRAGREPAAPSPAVGDAAGSVAAPDAPPVTSARAYRTRPPDRHPPGVHGHGRRGRDPLPSLPPAPLSRRHPTYALSRPTASMHVAAGEPHATG